MNLWHYFELGGMMMWPLLVCSILLGAVLCERAWVIGLRGILLRQSLSPDTRLWHRRVLPFFNDVPPSLGLLGTVFGVVQSFHLADGQITGEHVGSGLAIACMTTIFGLSIAVIASAVGYMLEWLANQYCRCAKPT